MSSKLFDHAGLVAGTGLAALGLWYWSRPTIPLPPGPKGNLIVGSAFELRNSSAFWLQFLKYSEQYGSILTVRILFRNMIVISDPNLVSELFDKRATQYSDRRTSNMAKLVGWDRVFLQYGPYSPMLNHYRTLLQRALNNRVVVDYLPLQEHEAKRMMRRLLETPEKFMEHIHLMAGSVAIRMVYGCKVDSKNDPLARSAEQVMAIFADLGAPGKWVVEIIPLLRYLPTWFPGATFHKAVAAWKPAIREYEEDTFNFVKQQLAAGTAEQSFVSKLLQPESGKEVSSDEELHIKRLAAMLYGAASDTTASIIKSFFLAMTLYPDAQSKAQAEIAAYLEQKRTGSSNDTQSAPQFITVADRPNLPYTSALLRELQRWHPVAPLIGHSSWGKSDDLVVVDGKTYRIPARTLVLVNVWGILHDPDVYPNPGSFIPERFLVENPPPIPETYTFGFGRRLCPGIHVAQQSM